jgi:hypothetical protein
MQNQEIEHLKSLISQARQEKLEFRNQLKELWNEHTRVKEDTELHRKELETERQHLLSQADKKPQNTQHDSELAKILKEKEDALGQLCTARQEVDTLMHIIQEKEEIIQVMERNHDELWKENEALLEALHSSSVPAEPPPEVSSLYNPIVDIYPQSSQKPRNLMADIGSTGSSFAKEHEEAKEVQYASPDPTENLLHQSTGETTVQNIEYGAATPPQEQIYDESGQETPTHVWESWEERPRTPPRDQRTPRTSGASTPHRDSFERTSSPQIFNLISSSNNQHIEEPEDFFTQMISEESKRGYDTIPKSLFD